MQKKVKQKITVSYEPEADVLMWELNNGVIDHAEEAGNMVVHFSKSHVPVLVELLDAKQFFAVSKQAFVKRGHSVKIALPA